MSTKRVLSITIFGLLLIATAIGAMLLFPRLNRDSAAVELPDTPMTIDRPSEAEPDALSRVEVNRDTIQAVVSTLLPRPAVYSREVIIDSFWEGGQATFAISTTVKNGNTSLHIFPPVGQEKRIIVTPDALYIWYVGDDAPFVSLPASGGDSTRAADEWQMLATFEDILRLRQNDIVDAGFTEFDGEVSVFALYRTPGLGNLRRHYISIDLGLVVAVREYDASGMLIYAMTAGEAQVGIANPEAFTLPDGTLVRFYS
ncbi:MAG: hypothetical protein FWB97_04315 [Oscillospiraceae bacterium]|nr:hypothetical protein [Oscillospiraceae bacterium]